MSATSPLPAALVCRWRGQLLRGARPRRSQLAYVHFDNPRATAKPLTHDEARRIAANIAKLPVGGNALQNFW